MKTDERWEKRDLKCDHTAPHVLRGARFSSIFDNIVVYIAMKHAAIHLAIPAEMLIRWSEDQYAPTVIDIDMEGVVADMIQELFGEAKSSLRPSPSGVKALGRARE